MTAIGFAKLLLCIAVGCAVIGWLDEHVYLPAAAVILGTIVVMLGIASVSYGIAFWLWDILF